MWLQTLSNPSQEVAPHHRGDRDQPVATGGSPKHHAEEEEEVICLPFSALKAPIKNLNLNLHCWPLATLTFQKPVEPFAG
jgi:hypothetical protein